MLQISPRAQACHKYHFYKPIETKRCIYAMLNLAITASGNGLSPVQCKAVIRTNADLSHRGQLINWMSKYPSETRVIWHCLPTSSHLRSPMPRRLISLVSASKVAHNGILFLTLERSKTFPIKENCWYFECSWAQQVILQVGLIWWLSPWFGSKGSTECFLFNLILKD